MHWISRIDASHFDPATAYVSVDGHRRNDLKPYVFVTRDYGKTVQSISANLPAYGNVQVIREDPVNRRRLSVGTEFGRFISLDGGRQWQKFMNNLSGRTIRIIEGPRRPGINRVMWNLTAGGQGAGGGRGGFGGPTVDPGTSIVTLSGGDTRITKSVRVLQDLWLKER